MVIRYGENYQPLEEATGVDFFFAVGPKEALFHYRNLALFTIRRGCEIAVSPVVEGYDSDLLANTLIGTPMGIILLQRGFLVLHASAVEINGKIACFLGVSGSGKSTTVLSLIRTGHKLVSDDVVAIDASFFPTREVLPGYPWMKVGNELISRFDLQKDLLNGLGRSEDKMRYNLLADNFAGDLQGDLTCAYILQWGEDFSIKRMTESEALLNLVKHEYGLVPKSQYPADTKERFNRASGFVKAIPFFSLQRPHALDKLDRLAGMITEHLNSL